MFVTHVHAETQRVMDRFKQLCDRSERLPFPTSANRIKIIVLSKPVKEQKAVIEQVVRHADSTRVVLHARVVNLMQSFLQVKSNSKHLVEMALYRDMTVKKLLQRMVTKRPLVFFNATDQFLLKTGEDGSGGFDEIGTDTEKPPLLLKDFQSYDEIALSALVALSTPTFFINNGSRGNQARVSDSTDHEESGVYIAQVGSRFERSGCMEYRMMAVSEEQNTVANGYGKSGDSLLLAWAKFYLKEYLPVFEEAHECYIHEQKQQTQHRRYVKLKRGFKTVYLDLEMYKTRCEITAEIFLNEANARGKHSNQKVFCRVVGLGLGVWAVDLAQKQILVDAYATVASKTSLPYISDLTFSWFKNTEQCGEATHGELLAGPACNTIKVFFSQDNPADKLTGDNEGKMLVAQYAWDGGCYPGNEYWIGMLSASGDPAAACCSCIAELQNPDVNCENVNADSAVVVTEAKGVTKLFEADTAKIRSR